MLDSSKSKSEWETPLELFDLLNREFHFERDAAANIDNHLCQKWFEGPHDPTGGCGCGLCADWRHERVFCNPPFGSGLPQWIAKFQWSWQRGATVVAILPANTDTRWFYQMMCSEPTEIRFLIGRVQFLLPGGIPNKNGNPGGTMVAIWNGPKGWTGGAKAWAWHWKK